MSPQEIATEVIARGQYDQRAAGDITEDDIETAIIAAIEADRAQRAPVEYAGGFSNDLEALEHVFTLVGMARFNRKQAFGNGPFAAAKIGNAREYAQAAQDILSTFIARNS